MTYDISLTDGGASLKCLRRKPRVQFAELAMLSRGLTRKCYLKM